MNYWGGATPDENRPYVTCGCGMTRTCQNVTQLCNCDSNDADRWLQDGGWLTVKDDLPVTEFSAGDTGKTERASSKCDALS